MLLKYRVELVFFGFIIGTYIYEKRFSWLVDNLFKHVIHKFECKYLDLLLFFSVSALLFLVGVYVLRRLHSFAFLCFFLSAFFLGIGNHAFHVFKEPIIADNFIGRKIKFLGMISEKPDVRETSVRLFIDLEKILVDDSEIDVSLRVLVVVKKEMEYSYGDELKFTGALALPENFLNNETDRVFNYVDYLRVKKIKYEIKNVSHIEIRKNSGNSIKKFLFKIYETFRSSLDNILPEPHSSLAGGILLGDKKSLGKDIESDFRKSGIIHLVVLSGFNVTIISVIIMNLLKRFNRITKLIIGTSVLFLFVIMVGTSATVMRSALMGLVSFLGITFNKKLDIFRVLVLVGSLMIFVNPLILKYDPSFQLSFLATLGLVLFHSSLSKTIFSKISEKFSLRDIFSSTISAQIMVTPLLIYSIGEISLVSPIINLLVVPIMPVTMLLSFLAGFTNLFFQFLSLPIGWLATLFLEYILLLADHGSSFIYSSIVIKRISPFFIYVSYIIILLVAYILKRIEIKSKLQNK